MEYDLNSFTSSLIELFTNSYAFPYSKDYYLTKNGRLQDIRKKHKNREPLHLKDAVIRSIVNSRVLQEDMNSFDIGNEQMELMHPYYHILQDAPYIHKAGEATDKSKGSQAKIEKGKRNYAQISFNGKTYSREYAKNIRGKRNRIGKVSHWARDYNGDTYFVNRESKEYLNVHYHYIDRILDQTVDTLASMYGLRTMRKKMTGLEDDYNASEVIDAISSFEEE